MLQFFESEGTSTDLPFLSDLLKTTQGQRLNGKVYDVNEISYASSGKGYTIKTDAFMTFLWKKSKVTQQLLEALNFYWEQGNGYVVVAKIDISTKGGCLLGVDFERTSYWQKKEESFFNSLNPVEDIPLMAGSNPFLPPTFPITQQSSLKKAEGMSPLSQSSHQTSHNGSKTSRKRSKVESIAKSPNQP